MNEILFISEDGTQYTCEEQDRGEYTLTRTGSTWTKSARGEVCMTLIDTGDNVVINDYDTENPVKVTLDYAQIEELVLLYKGSKHLSTDIKSSYDVYGVELLERL